MAIEIRIESSWDTDDGDGRRVEVTVSERRDPAEDPLEDTRYFATGDLERVKQYVSHLIDRKSASFMAPMCRECVRCGRVVATNERSPTFRCESCHDLAEPGDAR
jgi:hypothetical protein